MMKKQVLLNKIEQKKTNLQLKQAIHFTKVDSVVQGEQTDIEFITDVKQISEKRQATLQSFFPFNETEVISQDQCDEIQEIAILHKEANLFNSTSMLQPSQIQPDNFCQCGCQRGKGDPFPLTMDEQDLTFLGPGVLLIFFYLRQVRWTLFLVFLTYGVFSISTNFLMADTNYCWQVCKHQTGIEIYFCFLAEITSFKRKIYNEILVQFQQWIGFLMCVIWIFSVKFIKHLGDSKNEEIDQLLDSASDYTVRIDDLPSGVYNQYDLIEYVKQLWNTRQIVTPESVEEQSANHFVKGIGFDSDIQPDVQLGLRSVQLIYNMEDTRRIINEVLNLSYQICKCLQDFDQNAQVGPASKRKSSQRVASIKIDQAKQVMTLSKKFSSNSSNARRSSVLENIRVRKASQKRINLPVECKIKQGKVQSYLLLKAKLITRYTQLNNLRNNFLQDKEFRKSLSTTCALIEFESNEQQKQFLSYFSADLHKNAIQAFFCESKKLTFKDKEIKINRAAQPSDMIWLNCQKEFSLVRYLLILAGAILVLACSYTLIHLLRTSPLLKDSNQYLNAVMIQCFNRIIWITLGNLVVLEYNNTKTDSIISLMKLSITAQVINVIVSPLIFNFFVNDSKIYGFGGMSGNVVIYQFIMFIMMTFFYVLNPFYYAKKLVLALKVTRNMAIRNLCEVVGEVDTIDEIKPVLSYYEGPDFPVAGGYVYMTTAIFHTLFYCHLEPIVILFAIINISGFLIIMKYILFRRCRIPELTQIQIFDFAMFCLSCGAASFGAGSLYFLVISKYILRQDIGISQFVPSALCIIIWFTSSMNPFEIFTKSNQFLLKYLGFDKKSEEELQAKLVGTQSRIGARKDQLLEANNILLKLFAQEGLISKKAKRKESYYQYSNVKRLLNYEAELKEVIIGEEEKNNIIFFCESFCNSEKQEEFKKKSCVNGIKKQNIMRESNEQGSAKVSIKKRNASKTVPQRAKGSSLNNAVNYGNEKSKTSNPVSNYVKRNDIRGHRSGRNSKAKPSMGTVKNMVVHQQSQEQEYVPSNPYERSMAVNYTNKQESDNSSSLIPVIKL